MKRFFPLLLVGLFGGVSVAALILGLAQVPKYNRFSSSATSHVSKGMVPQVELGRQNWGVNHGGLVITEGYGQARPVTIYNGGDPTGRVEDVRWDSWGGPTAIGHGTSYASGPVGVAGGHFEPATVLAFDRGSCAGRPAYLAIQWYFPGEVVSLHPEQYIEICDGEYVDLTCLSYMQATQVLHGSGRGSLARSEVRLVLCHGPSWADALLVNARQDPIGNVAFHLVSHTWTVIALSAHSSPVYCEELRQQQAPADMLLLQLNAGVAGISEFMRGQGVLAIYAPPSASRIDFGSLRVSQ